jgi:prepilin-type N-terminal cleavage/methylation domain-containing protein
MMHNSRQNQNGFSLIEIMIVLVIIGVGFATVRLAVTQSDPLEDVEKSMNAFSFWFINQQQTSLLTNTEIGLFFTESGISALSWREGVEEDNEEAIVWEETSNFEYSTKVNDLIAELILDNESQQWINLESEIPEDSYDLIPHIILFPSEEYEPSFTLSFYRDSYLDQQLIGKGDGYNALELTRETR